MGTKKTALYLIDEDAPFDLQMVTPRLLEMRHPDDDLDPYTMMMRQGDQERLIGMSGTNQDWDQTGPMGNGYDYLDDAHYRRDMLVDMTGYGMPIDQDPLFRDSYGPESRDNIGGNHLGDFRSVGMGAIRTQRSVEEAVNGLGDLRTFIGTAQQVANGNRAAAVGLAGWDDVTKIVDRVLSIRDRLAAIALNVDKIYLGTVEMGKNIYDIYGKVKDIVTKVIDYWNKIFGKGGYWDTVAAHWETTKTVVKGYWNQLVNLFNNLTNGLNSIKTYVLNLYNEVTSRLKSFASEISNIRGTLSSFKSEAIKIATDKFDVLTNWIKDMNTNLSKVFGKVSDMWTLVDQAGKKIEELVGSVKGMGTNAQAITTTLNAQVDRLNRLITSFESQAQTLSKITGKFDELIAAVKGTWEW